jgi:hypothetical protein
MKGGDPKERSEVAAEKSAGDRDWFSEPWNF